MRKKRKAKTEDGGKGTDEQRPPKQGRVDPPSPLSFHSPASLFSSLIQPMDKDQFFRDYWEKKPLHLQRCDPPTAAYYHSLFQLSDLQSLCSQGLQYYRDINVVRCIRGKKKVLNKQGQVKDSVLRKNLVQDKATIQFHQPQRFKDELWRIQEKLECFFGALVGSNVYITPQGSQGLPVHYDDVEVFILQLEGQKRWRLYSPTVPLATEYSAESEDRIGCPTHDIILQAGDLLYFPRGTIHQAGTPVGVERSTHLTLSTYQRMARGDLLLDAFPSLLLDGSRCEVSLREGLPPRFLLGTSDCPHVRAHLASSLRCLAEGVESGALEVRSPLMRRDFLLNRLPPYSSQLLTPAGRTPTLEDVVCLRFKEHVLVTVEPGQQTPEEASDPAVIVLHSLTNRRETHMMGGGEEEEEQEAFGGLRFPLSHLQALQTLQQADRLPVARLQLPSPEERLCLVVSLWSESLLVVLEEDSA
ncbi:ribosomal oxygenase 2 [Antennarius striatus]|uniref:ribosomal oxygenase 2 n=1 Tax=Antennarius striatus TaxID=241820 RepID=UPI0035B3036A